MIAPFTQEASDATTWQALRERFTPLPVKLVWVTVPAHVAWERRRARGLTRDVAAMDKGDVARPTGPVVSHLQADGTADLSGEVERLIGELSSDRVL